MVTLSSRYAVKGRGDHPDTGPYVCDGLRQMYIAMKQHCAARR